MLCSHEWDRLLRRGHPRPAIGATAVTRLAVVAKPHSEASWQPPAGADIVHGHSSHHMKGCELYRGKLVAYGCGDLIRLGHSHLVAGTAAAQPSAATQPGTLIRWQNAAAAAWVFSLSQRCTSATVAADASRSLLPLATRICSDYEGIHVST